MSFLSPIFNSVPVQGERCIKMTGNRTGTQGVLLPFEGVYV